jgi:SAM-dependent methyltransferase
VTEPLDDALQALRPLLLDANGLVRAIAAGRRRGTQPDWARGELRPVDLKAGRHLQLTTTDGRTPTIRNLAPGAEAGAAVDALLAQPFGSWHVETADQVVQLRVTKSGQAQVHRADAQRSASGQAGHDRAKQHLIDPDDPLFAVLGADAAKRRQVDAFLRLLVPAARKVAAALDSEGADRPLRVTDLGCGNAYLTMAAHRYLSAELDRPVQTIGIDVRPEMAQRNTEIAEQAGLDGLSFAASSIEDAQASVAAGGPIDLVLALHACDTATDDALALAVRWGARAVLAAPCCHHDLQRQLDQQGPGPQPGLIRHAILRERFADVLTDAVRADLLRLLGYRTDVVEFIDSRHTPRNAMIRAVHTGTPPTPRRVAEYLDLVAAWQVQPVLAQRLAPELAPFLAAGSAPGAGA